MLGNNITRKVYLVAIIHISELEGKGNVLGESNSPVYLKPSFTVINPHSERRMSRDREEKPLRVCHNPLSS